MPPASARVCCSPRGRSSVRGAATAEARPGAIGRACARPTNSSRRTWLVPWPRTILLVVLLLPLLIAAAAQSRATQSRAGVGLQPHPELLVSPEWLAVNLSRKNLRIVDIRDAKDYRRGHIPGAVHLSMDALSTVRDGVLGMLPAPAIVQEALRAAGIGKDTTVIGYGAANGLFAARLFWALDYLGHNGGRVLDGGWRGWLAEGRPVTREVPVVNPSRFTARPQPEKIADLGWVRERLGNAATVMIDARSPGEYDGTLRYAMRGGHIPGAKLFHWKRHLDPRRPPFLRPLDQIGREYEALGLSPEIEIVVYCQTLMRAAHSYFVLRVLGYGKVRGYDGSWAEWGNRRDTPVTTVGG